MSERKVFFISAVVFSLLAAANCTQAEIRNVPGDYPTIQAAIDDANDGDTVLIAPGTYTGDGNRDIDFMGKAITVKSEDGYETCIIDCQGCEDEPHRGFFFHNGEDANSVLQGFTITNGYEYRGGGMYCYKTNPYILDCLITSNAAYAGGGIECSGSNSTILGCIISNNKADFRGGVSIDQASIRDQDMLITMINCLICGNKAMKTGGGIGCDNNGVGFDLLNCTVSGNYANVGGGIRYGYPKRKIYNSIIYGNVASTGSEIAIISPPAGAAGCGENTLEIAYSVVGNDPNAIYFTSCNGYISGQWLQVDPLFAQPGYWIEINDTNIIVEPNDPNAIWIDGDYHLKSQAGRWDPNSQSWVKDDVTSPCIDAGDPNSPVGDEPEPHGGRINMGAYGGTSEASKSYNDE